MKHIFRRDFLKLSIASSVGLSLSRCGISPNPPQTPSTAITPTSTSTSTPSPTSTAQPPRSVRWILTKSDYPWVSQSPINLELLSGNSDVLVDSTRRLQSLDGFGGAFNEKGWEVLQVLPAAQREEVFRALFDPSTGARLLFGRVPIGASDFAVDRYTDDEYPGDYKMEHFSITRDQQRLIPFIQSALLHQPALRLWGSAWSPPSWMKDNGQIDGGSMLDDPKVYDAYALYLMRWIQAYQELGMDLYMVVPQNEPGTSVAGAPTCGWTPQQYLVFIRDHMGPLFERNKVNARIFLGTLSDNDYTRYPQTVLGDPAAAHFVSGVGVQWFGLELIAPIRQNFPSMYIMQTETECGNRPWLPEFNPDKPPNDWAYGIYTWDKLKEALSAGCNSYMLWNMVLDTFGHSLSIPTWPQNAAITVDIAAKTYTLTPMYYAIKHLSAFVDAGAHLLETRGGYTEVLAFQNPNADIVLVLQNSQELPAQINVKIGAQGFHTTLPAKSWSTFILPAGS